MPVDPEIVKANHGRFAGLYESMKTAWADRRAQVQQAVERWIMEQGQNGNEMLSESLRGWADSVLLPQYAASLSLTAGAKVDIALVDDEDYWRTYVRDHLPDKLKNSRNDLYKAVFGG